MIKEEILSHLELLYSAVSDTRKVYIASWKKATLQGDGSEARQYAYGIVVIGIIRRVIELAMVDVAVYDGTKALFTERSPILARVDGLLKTFDR